MNKTSAVTILIPHDKYVQFKARLVYDKIRVSSFMRSIIKMYLENDEQFTMIMSKIKEEKSIDTKKKREKNINLIKKSNEISALFNLNNEEVRDLYDILEEEDENM